MTTSHGEADAEAIADAMQVIISATPKQADGNVSPKALMEACGMIAAGLFASMMERADEEEVSLAAKDIVNAFTTCSRSADANMVRMTPLH